MNSVDFEDNQSRRLEPGSQPSDRVTEENSIQNSFSKQEDDMSRRIEPASQHSPEEYGNTMKMHSTMPEDDMSRKLEPSWTSILKVWRTKLCKFPSQSMKMT